MRSRVAAVVFALASMGSVSAETYPQLISTRYSDRSKLPADFVTPPETYEFVDKAKLPQGAKVLSAAKSATGKVWIVTDKGTFTAKGDAYAPLEIGPRHPELGHPPVPANARIAAVAA